MKAVVIDDDRFAGRTSPYKIEGEVLDWFHEMRHQPIDVPHQRVTLWADGVNIGEGVNTDATALLWYWSTDRQSVESLCGQVYVTGLRGGDGKPTALDDATYARLVKPSVYRVELAGFAFPISGQSDGSWHFQKALGLLQLMTQEMRVSDVSFDEATETITAQVAR